MLCFVGVLAASLSAQQVGPLHPPPSSGPDIPVVPSQTAQTPAAARTAVAPLSTDPPSIPPEQIIQRFAQHESEFKAERDNFTYVQTFSIQTIDDAGRVDGEYKMTSDITFTPDGKRDEHVTYAPPSTLERITMSQQDMADLENVQPFVLTAQDLPKYNVTYVGRQPVDEVGAYVFDVAPKTIEKNQRYFQGRIWVDDKDYSVVKTDGKAVPDIRTKNNENVFPRFETYRENIEGEYWFPTYTHADDELHFKTGDVHIRMSVRYADYKRFRVSIRLLPTPQNKQ